MTVEEIPWALVAPLIGLQVILAVVAIIDIARSYATNGPKWLWVLISIFTGIIGPILYFIIGRKNQ
ncbi:PLD nuclease N-terminal domain-containing protein [Solibacillus sp. FSL H8-0538]|uniref:PLD nuclease N-terminal domain-containing protein n=1 Tax=Solibacillus sp. FSL H8-0538 TaxID=2921400 RepID=UPI0030FB5837